MSNHFELTIIVSDLLRPDLCLGLLSLYFTGADSLCMWCVFEFDTVLKMNYSHDGICNNDLHYVYTYMKSY